VVVKPETRQSSKLVSAGFVFSISCAASPDYMILVFKNFGCMMLETDWEVRCRIVDHYVFPVSDSVSVRSFALDKFGEIFITDSGLTEINHGCGVACLD
jgi:hypothetical protein